jgi:hypothetical protein
MRRSKMSKRSSKRNFRKSSRSRSINRRPFGARGGIRL